MQVYTTATTCRATGFFFLRNNCWEQLLLCKLALERNETNVFPRSFTGMLLHHSSANAGILYFFSVFTNWASIFIPICPILVVMIFLFLLFPGKISDSVFLGFAITDRQIPWLFLNPFSTLGYVMYPTKERRGLRSDTLMYLFLTTKLSQ